MSGVGATRRLQSLPVAAVRLTVVASEGEAEVVCGMLRAAGIRSGYRATDTTGAVGAARMLGGWREVLVDEADLERARELVAGAEPQ